MPKIRVMIVEDSKVAREFLQFLIEQDVRLEVVAAVESAEEALRILHQASPDVISMDIRLPGMNGFEATRQIMCEKPTPIVVVSASVEAEDLKISMNALRAGALSVVEKPVGMTHQDYQAMADRLRRQLVLMSEVKVVRQRRRPEPGAQGPLPASAGRGRLPDSQVGPFRMVGIVASTGGPAALQTLLAALGSDFPLPLLLVQHIADGFLEGFRSWLDGICSLQVLVAEDRTRPEPGRVYLAPADRHLRLAGGQLRLDSGPMVCTQRPSGTILFRSMAESLGPGALAVLLTGMGEDGAQGMQDIRHAGGYTIAEDESTAVVYGMPAAAVRLGGVCESLPIDQIGGRLLKLACAKKEAR